MLAKLLRTCLDILTGGALTDPSCADEALSPRERRMRLDRLQAGWWPQPACPEAASANRRRWLEGH